MGFFSLMIMGIVYVMWIAGVFCLIAALILAIVNRRQRKKKGKPSRGVRIAAILFLALGAVDVLPFLIMVAYTGVHTIQNKIWIAEQVRKLPERAELEITYHGSEREEVLVYQENEYVPVNVVPVLEMCKLSGKKAYARYEDTYSGVVYEVETDTGYDLLCVLPDDDNAKEEMKTPEGMLDTDMYCRRGQEDEFIRDCRSAEGAYRMYEEDSGEEKVLPKTFGIVEEFIDGIAGHTAEKEDYEAMDSESVFVLYQEQMGGRFLAYCTHIGENEGTWYCNCGYVYLYQGYAENWFRWYPDPEGEEEGGYELPDEVQAYMKDIIREDRQEGK